TGGRQGTKPTFQATGGPVIGPGPKGVDSELRMLAPGEHVWTDKEVDAVGGHVAMHAMRQAALKGGLTRSAGDSGRQVRYAAPAPAPAPGGGAVSLEGLAVYVENPWTGEQVRATVKSIADKSASGAIRAANDDLKRGRAR
ncbi:MAG: hypothetical protein ACRDTJ_13115, partial [Pseudonocardiaceae bacterium]